MTGVTKMMLGLRTVDQCMTHNPAWGMRAHVIDLNSLERTHTFELDPFVVFHFGNAREIGDELIVELVRFPDFTVNQGLRDFTHHYQSDAGEPGQLRLNLRTGKHTYLPPCKDWTPRAATPPCIGWGRGASFPKPYSCLRVKKRVTAIYAPPSTTSIRIAVRSCCWTPVARTWKKWPRCRCRIIFPTAFIAGGSARVKARPPVPVKVTRNA